MQLPPDLRARIEERLTGVAQRDLAAWSVSVSRAYLERKENLQIKSKGEAQAYIAARLPATWGAARDVLSRLPFAPQTMLDIGAGPGTCTLAARSLWPDITSTLIEKNRYLQDEGQFLCPDEWIAQDLSSWTGSTPRDLVIAGYVLNEFADFDVLLGRMWAAAGKVLVLIEPGTPQGFEVILRAREQLMAAGAHIAAPCPHMMACPLAGYPDRWCHFSIRVERSKLHRAVKGGELGYEDEKFSYLIATRGKMPLPAARVIGHPRGSKLVEAELCLADGTYKSVKASKRDDIYKRLRKAKWGDSL